METRSSTSRQEPAQESAAVQRARKKAAEEIKHDKKITTDPAKVAEAAAQNRKRNELHQPERKFVPGDVITTSDHPKVRSVFNSIVNPPRSEDTAGG